MFFSKRIEILSSLIKEGESVADIGTDHGWLPILLIEREKSPWVIASDISAKSLKKLDGKLSDSKYSSKIRALVSDGLKEFKEPYPETLVMAGMGGDLIIKILEESIEKVRLSQGLVFQANTKRDELRRFLHSNGWFIVEEKAFFDEGIYYNIFRAEKGRENSYEDFEYRYGKLLVDNKNQALKEYLLKEKKGLVDLIIKLKNLNKPPLKRIGDLEEILRINKEALGCY